MARDNHSAREVVSRSAGFPADEPSLDADVGRFATLPVAAYFADFFENSPHDLFVLDVRQDGRFVFEHINPALTKSTGYTYEMLVGKSPEEVLTPANISGLAARYRACVETRQRVEYDVTAMTPIGKVIRHTILVPIVDRSGVVRKVLGTSTDVTALRHTEARLASQTQELRELVERLVNERALSELIIENSGDGIIVVDTDLRYLVWNPAIESIHGKTRDEVLGKTVFEIDPGFADHQVGNAWRKAISGQRAEIRDYRFFSRVRGTEVIYDADFTPLYSRAAAIVGAICILHETTDRRRAEEMLLQSQKLEAIAQLTGGVAHDFNNLLTAVIGCLDLIAYQSEPSRATRLVETARRAAERGAQLVQQLLAFARRQSLHAVSADIGSLLTEIEVLLRNVAGEAIDLVFLPAGVSLWRTRVDRAQLEAAVMNLVINSRDAMPHGGRITVRTSNVSATDLPGDVDLRSGDYVALAVEDNGEGMTPEIAARAFDPFFTTKEVGKGTGLGLSMAHGFAVQSGGTLRLQSARGVGTCVTLYLPREQSAAEADRESPGAEPLGGTGTVLVVEDDEQVRAISVEMLSSLGYRVHIARDGHQALAILEGGEAVELLFTDLVMPNGMSGIELGRQACRIKPGLAVLLTTGYALQQSAAPDEFPVIAKPLRLAVLSEAVGRLLSKTRRRTTISGNGSIEDSKSAQLDGATATARPAEAPIGGLPSNLEG
jgi:PAS domain S-box-containing protein